MRATASFVWLAQKMMLGEKKRHFAWFPLDKNAVTLYNIRELTSEQPRGVRREGMNYELRIEG